MGLYMGPGAKPATVPQGEQDEYLQAFKSATSDEYIKKVDADTDESDS